MNPSGSHGDTKRDIVIQKWEENITVLGENANIL